MKYPYSYLIKIQFLGFRFHGWQKQTNQKTLHQSVDKTLGFVFGHSEFKSLGSGRTDAKVSSQNYTLQLFTKEPISKDSFVLSFNENSPSDIKTSSIEEIQEPNFNIIQSPKIKEYHYYFSNDGKNHPYAAPFMSGYKDLNIELMQEGAKLFEGTHFFGKYCTKPTENTELIRTIGKCQITENQYLKANFFPRTSYVLVVRGAGFLRYQIRLMMGVLIELGMGNCSIDDIKDSLIEKKEIKPLSNIAPASGLHLYDVSFQTDS